MSFSLTLIESGQQCLGNQTPVDKEKNDWELMKTVHWPHAFFYSPSLLDGFTCLFVFLVLSIISFNCILLTIIVPVCGQIFNIGVKQHLQPKREVVFHDFTKWIMSKSAVKRPFL